MKLKLVFVLLSFQIVFLSNCKDKDALSEKEIIAEYLNLPTTPFDYLSLNVPDFLDKKNILLQDNTPLSAATSNQIVTLGRVLFYDKNLSKNNATACASCHIQKYGFSDTATLSVGHLGGKTKRHSMGLANARFRVSARYFWDGRADNIEGQVLQPILDPVEMGMSISELVSKLNKLPYYPILFKQAYGVSDISEQKIKTALAAFVRSMISFDSKYDQGRKNRPRDSVFNNFSPLENLGKSLFFNAQKGNCGGCHNTDAMVIDSPRNNGISFEEFLANDVGYEVVSGNVNDRGKFLPPSLRNIAVRPPYMHDGRFKTLSEVIEHYSDNIAWSSTLDEHLKNGTTPARFQLTTEEKEALEAFLNTLTDPQFLTDEKYSNPFR
ncbi:MAG: cytochrome-c peroxidase [Flavobacteriales bacterium]|nr:cytochrome-c peroxidase [Flavobacteriales bacterium]